MIGENLLDVVEKKIIIELMSLRPNLGEPLRPLHPHGRLYVLCLCPGVNGGEAAASDVYADDFLYDMQKDPWQLNNVVADPAYAAVKAETS